MWDFGVEAVLVALTTRSWKIELRGSGETDRGNTEGKITRRCYGFGFLLELYQNKPHGPVAIISGPLYCLHGFRSSMSATLG